MSRLRRPLSPRWFWLRRLRTLWHLWVLVLKGEVAWSRRRQWHLTDRGDRHANSILRRVS